MDRKIVSTAIKFYAEVKINYFPAKDILELMDTKFYEINDDEDEAKYAKEEGRLSIKSHQAIIYNSSNPDISNNRLKLYPNPENTISYQYKNSTVLKVYPELLSREKKDTYYKLLPEIIADDVYGEELQFANCHVLNKDEVYLYRINDMCSGENEGLLVDIRYFFFIIENNQLRVMSEQEIIDGYQTKLGYWYQFNPNTLTLHGAAKDQMALVDAYDNDLMIIHSLNEGLNAV